MLLDTKLTIGNDNNHSNNLEVLLKVRRQLSDLGDSQLNYLVQKCGVSTLQIYGYLNDLYNLGYKILNNINHDSDSLRGSSVKDVRRELNMDLPRVNLSNELENLNNDIHSARLFVMELIKRLTMDKMKKTMSSNSYDNDDALIVSRRTLVHSDSKHTYHTILH